jgi:transcriptional regulator with XRE-family HTH domain
MRSCSQDFPGVDSETSDRFAREVASDEEAIIGVVRDVREQESVSLEEIGFLLGIGPSQLSRYLKRTCPISLTNYVRIARALGYRCRVVLERAETHAADSDHLANVKISRHKVLHQRSTATNAIPVK